MQSFVAKKAYSRWLWHAIEHQTGRTTHGSEATSPPVSSTILAFVLGRREDRMFLKLKRLLKPFGITKFYTDRLKTYERHLSENERQVSKFKMQKRCDPGDF